jgi:hypothetical protein
MKNIHILPTDKPSRLFKCRLKGHFILYPFNNLEGCFEEGFDPQNIYITNDEEIKEGDWVFNIVQKTIFKADKSFLKLIGGTLLTNQKIILTTDQDLIKDGVQAIDDEFLEWFVKNPSCKKIRVEKHWEIENWYRIIIPKEEHKQDNKWSESTGDITSDYFIAQSKAIQKCMHLDAEIAYRSLPKRGKSYNEEDMFNFLEFINNRYYGSFSIDKEDLQDWFEQFKK